jgi:hypothetical protein
VKKIHELLDNVQINDIEIRDEFMSVEEKNRILELTLNKAGVGNIKLTKKRLILPLAAAMTLVLSFAVVFAQGGLSEIYYRLFGDNIKYVNEMGTIIDESSTSNAVVYDLVNKSGETGISSEVTMKVVSMLGDENSFYIIFELIKENGESFKEPDYIEFDSLSLDFNSSGGYTWEKVEDDNPDDNKATFILYGNTRKKITGDKLTLSLENFSEYSIKEANGFNAYDFLLNNSEYINQSLIENKEKEPVREEDNNLPIDVLNKMKEIYKLTPNNVLPWKYSNIFVEENIRDMYVDNVGFVENKLCIRFTFTDSETHDFSDVYFVNKNNPDDIIYNEFVQVDEKDGAKYDYYIFDISDMEQLKNYDLKYTIMSKIKMTTGSWEVNFKADYKNNTETIRVNKETEINEKKYFVKNIKISPISLNIEMNNNIIDNLNEPTHNFTDGVSIILKDGSTPELTSGGSSTNSLFSSINLMFKQPLDTSQIEKVKIGNIEIKLNESND